MTDTVSQTDVSCETPVLGVRMITNEAYHQGPGISKSHLDVAARSLAHYWAAYVDPKRKPREATPAMILGTAIHTAILEPDDLAKSYVVEPEDINKRTKAGKEEYEAFLAQLHGRIPLTASQWETVVEVRDAVWRDRGVRELLKAGKPEISFFATDEGTGELVKCRTDWLDWDRRLVVDVKSTEDASPQGFMRSVMNYRYHVQVPWYLDVIDGAMGVHHALDWVFLAVEKSPPYAVGLYRLPLQLVQAARRIARRDLERIAMARAADSWPGYTHAGVIELEPPAWAMRQAGVGDADNDYEGLSDE